MPIPPYPTVPSPSTWVNGAVSASELREDVSNAVNYLANRPQFTGLADGGASVGSGSNFLVPMTVDVSDPWQGHDPLGTHPDAWYLPPDAAGWYLVSGMAGWNYTGGGTVTFTTSLQAVQAGGTTVLNGEQLPVSNTQFPGPSVCDLVLLTRTGAPGASGVDTVSLLVTQNSGGALPLAVAPGQPVTLQPWLSARWVAAQSGSAGLPVPANPPSPVPPAYIDEAWLNANIRDTISFLTYPPVFRGRLSASNSLSVPSQTLPNGTALPLDTVTVDNYSGFSGAAAWVAPCAGQYFAYAQAGTITPTANGLISCGLGVTSGGTTASHWGKAFRGTASAITVSASKRLRLNAGDQVTLMFSQGTGSTLTLSGPTRLICVWEGQ